MSYYQKNELSKVDTVFRLTGGCLHRDIPHGKLSGIARKKKDKR